MHKYLLVGKRYLIKEKTFFFKQIIKRNSSLDRKFIKKKFLMKKYIKNNFKIVSRNFK